MLRIEVQTDDAKRISDALEVVDAIKRFDVTTVHNWKIPCGSGIELRVELHGPVGMKVESHHFDQAIRLLEIARDGVKTWPNSETAQE